ncbi:MAG: lamin tail domain-containing protein [Candidatus Eisenbacteria bacterium]
MGRRERKPKLEISPHSERNFVGVNIAALLLALMLLPMPLGLVGASGGVGPVGVVGGSRSVVINEVLYDPPGKDAGLEFVEVFNGSDEAVCLDGWRLESGNGSYENRWTLEWTGGAGDTVRPHSFFVVGEELVVPQPEAVTDLDLQNGPDACRLTSPGGGSDVVGWGDLTYPEYYETAPVAGPTSGWSIGRDPDGRDTDDNSSDFAGFATVSPGDFNHPPCDLALVKAAPSRYISTSGSDLDLVCLVSNLGAQPCGAGGEIAAAVGTANAISVIDAPIAPDGTAKFVVRLPHPGEGLHSAKVWLTYEADRVRANDTLVTTVVLPPPPIVVNEIMFKPSSSECEWIEVFNHSGVALDIKDWTLEDSGGKPKRIISDEHDLAPQGLLVLVEDEAALRRVYGDSAKINSLRPEGGWPTLNDVDGPLGFADAIVIRDGFGTVVDSVAYGERWSRPGISIERIDPRRPSTEPANWSPHYGAAGGSPGKANSVSFFVPDGQSILSVSPPTFSPDGDGQSDLVAISVRVPRPSQARLSIVDVNGRLVRRLLDGDLIESARITFWDGRDDDGSKAPVGVYIVAAEARPAGSGDVYRAKSPVILVRR